MKYSAPEVLEVGSAEELIQGIDGPADEAVLPKERGF